MRYLPIIALLLLSLASCQKEEKKPIDRTKTDWAFYQLEGEVMSVSEKSFEAVNANLERGAPKRENASSHDFDLIFDEQGMLVSEKQWVKEQPFEETTYMGRDRKLKQIQYMGGAAAINTEFQWDKAGKDNLSVIRRNPDNSQFDRKEMKYKDNKLIEKVSYSSQDTPTDKVTYNYDDKGNLTGENLYLNTEMVQFRNVYEYDENNNMVLEARYNKDDKLLFRTVNSYNDGRLMSSETFNGNGNSEYLKKFTYDNKGNITLQYINDITGKRESTDTYTYDDKGNRTQWLMDENNKTVMKVFYKYDEKGNVTEIKAIDGDGVVTEIRGYTYKYDQKGNWTEKVVLLNGKPEIVTERQIKYFDEL